MKFELEKALAGQPVKLRNGTKAYVRHHETELDTPYPLFGYREGAGKWDTDTWTASGKFCLGSDPEHGSDHDIVGMWVEPAVFDHWDALDPKWKFIAADDDGSICVFTARPDKYGTFWECREGDFSYATDLFNFQYTDWEHSLVERPTKE